jgi:hypothetical protein
MTDTRPIPLSLRSLAGWVVLPVLGASAFGSVATWLVAGGAGVAGQWLAVGCVLAVMAGSGSVTVAAASGGAGPASTTFLGFSLLRLLLCPGLVSLAWWASSLPAGPVAVWLVISYLSCLALEVAWLVAALRRNQQSTTEPQNDS